jgi:hypothetical protein
MSSSKSFTVPIPVRTFCRNVPDVYSRGKLPTASFLPAVTSDQISRSSCLTASTPKLDSSR